MKRDDLDNLVQLDTGGCQYIGRVVEIMEKKTQDIVQIELQDALPVEFSASKISYDWDRISPIWIKKYNLGELQTVTLRGTVSYTTTPIAFDIKICLKQLWDKMSYIKTTALQRLENKYFDEE